MKTLRWILWPFSILYGSIMEIRNFLFRKRILKSVEFDVPVISVGNLAVGGTGKTPMVKYLIEALSDDYKIGVLSRGYGRRTKGFLEVSETGTASDCGDEPLEIKQHSPQTIVAVCEDRVVGIPQLLNLDPEVNLVILDDAFQHQYVKPSVSIVLSIYDQPFFSDFVMPMGRLREFRKNIDRADLLVFTKSPHGYKAYSGLSKPTYYARTTADQLQLVYGDERMLSSALAVSGLANNQRFAQQIKQTLTNVETLSFSDHHRYTTKDVLRMVNRSEELDYVIVTTNKDWVKLKPIFEELGADVSVFVQSVRFEIEGEVELLARIKEKL
ncbi:MAG: tetraacyldisaccharide 4'-kinase [Bacteroidia bacterium]|nr:tetraacyldisaccharide 4'-kinase [Bacteroidia bacterium]